MCVFFFFTVLGSISLAEKEAAEEIRQGGLRLASLCLTYDFVGTSPSASTEDSAVLKIPSSWKKLFDEGNGTPLMDLFWSMFTGSAGSNRALAMAIIVELSCVRRSLFDTDESRNQHLSSIMNGITDVLLGWQEDRSILGDEDTVHEFCRLLARLKGNFQLKQVWLGLARCRGRVDSRLFRVNQIVNAEGYTDWIRLVGQFSLEQDWSAHANSHFYIMKLWSSLVSAIPYLDSSRSKTTTSGLLEDYGPRVRFLRGTVWSGALMHAVFGAA